MVRFLRCCVIGVLVCSHVWAEPIALSSVVTADTDLPGLSATSYVGFEESPMLGNGRVAFIPRGLVRFSDRPLGVWTTIGDAYQHVTSGPGWDNNLALVDSKGEKETRLHSQASKMEAASALISEKEWDTFRNRWTASADGRAFSAVDFGQYTIKGT